MPKGVYDRSRKSNPRPTKYKMQEDGFFHCLYPKCEFKHKLPQAVGRHAVVHQKGRPYAVFGRDGRRKSRKKITGVVQRYNETIREKYNELLSKEDMNGSNPNINTAAIYLAGKIEQQISDSAGTAGISRSELAKAVIQILRATIVR